MGVKELREAFNSVAEPAFSCTQALHGYERQHDAEYQVMTFIGVDAHGAAFSQKSPLLRAGTDLLEAARQAATNLLAQTKVSK